MRILGIETSCDETAAAVVEGTTPDRPVKILSNVIASSEEFHKKTGGIVPEVASREQAKVILPVIQEALAKIPNDIDAIAVTVGPGLVGSLLIGVETVKALSLAWEKPLIPVNHLVAHLYANWIEESDKRQVTNSFSSPTHSAEASRVKKATEGRGKKQEKVPRFPAVGLVASGGHTDLVLMKGHPTSHKASRGRVAIKHLGSTRDDAAGEAFDKIARMLGLGYPGGPAISAEAGKFKVQSSKFKVQLPRPMIDSEDYDFSFSGLKTAVLNLLRSKTSRLKPSELRLMKTWLAYETQEAICEVLTAKVKRAMEEFSPKSVLVAGGVAANNRLRQLLKSQISNLKSQIDLFIPPVDLCTDNAASIAAAAYYNHSPVPWQAIRVDPGLAIID